MVATTDGQTMMMTLDAQPAMFDAIYDAQSIFRTLLETMARPGVWRRLPAAVDGSGPTAGRWLLPIARTLIDHETTFAVVGLDAEQLAGRLTHATASRLVAVEAADYVFSNGAPGAEVVRALKRGLPAYPDESATLIVALAMDAAGVELQLRGPGIDGLLACTAPGLGESLLDALAEANATPPLGVDLIVISPDGMALALPRSTAIARTGNRESNGVHGG